MDWGIHVGIGLYLKLDQGKVVVIGRTSTWGFRLTETQFSFWGLVKPCVGIVGEWL